MVPLRLLSIKLIRNISGLGDSLTSGKKLQGLIATFLYRRASNQYWTFYQNKQDMLLGLSNKFSTVKNCSLLPGSGVDLEHFQYQVKSETKPYRILMAARLIPAKGYLDFIELARQFKSDPTLEFHLVGAFTKESGVSQTDFDQLLQDSGVVYHGYTEELAPLYQKSHLFILPSSYGEGLPRVLLEAAACGCALIAYNNPGSNRAIQQGTNGWSTREPSVAAMRENLNNYVALTHTEKMAMSKASRKHVENGFSETVVINSYLKLLTDILEET